MKTRNCLLGPVVSSVTFSDDTVAPEELEENVVKPGAEGSGGTNLSAHPRVIFR